MVTLQEERGSLEIEPLVSEYDQSSQDTDTSLASPTLKLFDAAEGVEAEAPISVAETTASEEPDDFLGGRERIRPSSL